MSARINFMKRVEDCKDVFIMSPQDEQWRRTSLLCLCTAFSVGITILNQRIIWKDDIELVTEFPCLLGHPVEFCKKKHIIHLYENCNSEFARKNHLKIYLNPIYLSKKFYDFKITV